jgi:formate hydrogenlyase subunit 3/multisubunit Na+/H+ antiporter MnhD subunit
MNILLLSIVVPAIAGLISFLIPKKGYYTGIFSTILAAFNLYLMIKLFGQETSFSMLWGGGWGLEFSLRMYKFASFILVSVALFAFLISLYSTSFMKDKSGSKQFFAYLLITIAQVNGVIMSDNLIQLLFFWEGLLLTLFGFIVIGGKDSIKTAVKAFIINGFADLCLMGGIAITGYIAGTFTMSKIALPTEGLGALAFVLLMIGAIAKAGAMPFHTWIPDAAKDAPLPFMAFVPGSLEKLLGIYFLARISLDLFKLEHGSWLSVMMMIIGAVTILFAVMMALIQKDFKKLLSYHAISQVGYMVLGIGTAVPVGIVGGLFHMINNALYKEGLFLAGGAIEKQTGTTDLKQLGGIGRKMPITCICFIVCALSISGVPPFNGFFSKELVYDAALESGWIFYLAAALGSFFTAASFLKLGHAAFFGKTDVKYSSVKEVSYSMSIPMIVIAGLCIFFGLYNSVPVNMITTVFGPSVDLSMYHLYGMPSNMWLVGGTIFVLAAAFINHKYGVKKTGSGIGAVDHIHHAPVLGAIYDKAERKMFDPYEYGVAAVNFVSKLAFGIDRANDWIYNVLAVKTANTISSGIRKAHTGNYSLYILWSLLGTVILAYWLIKMA